MSKLHGGTDFVVLATVRDDKILVRVTNQKEQRVDFIATPDELIKLSRKLLAVCNRVNFPPKGKV